MADDESLGAREQDVMIEGLEPRRLMAGDVSVSVPATTLPAELVGGAAVRGTVTVAVTNTSGARISGRGTVAVTADPIAAAPVGAAGTPVASVAERLTLGAGQTQRFVVPVTSVPATLDGGAYALQATVTDPAGATGPSTDGPAVTVSPPVLVVSATAVAHHLPAVVAAGGRSTASVSVTVTDGGNVPLTGPIRVAVFASVDGTLGAATLVAAVTPAVRILPGRSAVVTVRLAAFPAVATGTYALVAQVTDAAGGVAVTSPAASVRIAPPFVALTATVLPAIDFIDPTDGRLRSVTFDGGVRLTNTGTTASVGLVTIGLFVRRVPADDFPADLGFQYGTHVTPPLVIRPGQSRVVTFSTPLPDGPSVQVAFVAVSVTDPAGDVTYGNDPRQYDFDY